MNIWFGEYVDIGRWDRYLSALPCGYIRHLNLISRILYYPVKSTERILRNLASTLMTSSFLWHTRVWIIQEFILSKRLYACFGPVRFELRNLQNLGGYSLFPDFYARKISLSDDQDVALVDLDSQLRSLEDAQKTERERKLTIEMAYNRFGGMQATDPRDHVFSLVSLL